MVLGHCYHPLYSSMYILWEGEQYLCDRDCMVFLYNPCYREENMQSSVNQKAHESVDLLAIVSGYCQEFPLRVVS